MNRLTFFATLVGTSMAACSWHSPIMGPASQRTLDAPAPPDRARVVFVHGPYRLSPSAKAAPTVRIVEEDGHLLGDSLPATWFAVDLAPGHHAFYGGQLALNGEPTAEGCPCRNRTCAGVAAMTADLLPGRTYYVAVGVTEWRAKVSAYGEFAQFTSSSGEPDRIDFERVSSNVATWPAQFVKSLRPVKVDPSAASALASHGDANNRGYVCTGAMRIHEGSDWDAQLSALRPEDGATAPSR